MKKLFSVKARLNELEGDNSIPGHPEFVFVKLMKDGAWEMKNTDTDEIVTVQKVRKGKYTLFELSYL